MNIQVIYTLRHTGPH